MACGQAGHFRPDCTLVAPENRPVTGEQGAEASSSPSGSRGNGKAKAKAKSVVQAKGVTEEVGAQREGTTGTGSGAGAASVSSTVSQEALVAEAAKLLKGVSLRALRLEEVDTSWLRSALASASDPEYCLVDSGATNALRPAEGQELDGCRVIRVDLASGGTDLRINSHGTLLHVGPCQVILPASYLIELGYSISWKKKGCKIKHPRKGFLDVTVVKGCPLIPRSLGLKLLQEYEDKKTGRPLLCKGGTEDWGHVLEPQDARDWLRFRVAQRSGLGLTDVDQLVFLRSMFPGVKLQALTRACVPALEEGHSDWTELPWNRRFRRSIERGGAASALIAVASSSGSWKGLGRVISVADSERGIGGTLVFQVLMRWASSGLVGGVVKGALSRGEGDGEQRILGDEDLVHYLRCFLLFAVAQAAKECSSEHPVPQQGNSQGVSESVEAWAVHRAAVNLSSSVVSATQDGLRSRVFLACEPLEIDSHIHPQGPNSSEPCKGWLRLLIREYGLSVAEFDQGCLGAPGVWGSRVVTSSWFLYDTLHLVRAEGQSKVALEAIGALGLDQHLRSFGWIGNLWKLVHRAWMLWKWEQANQAEIEERRLILKKLSEQESMERHIANDHVPYRKGCPICIRAQGRQRSHWRSGFPVAHSLSVDVAGPLVSGLSWGVEASGRDQGKGYRYFLACAYTIPKDYGLGVEGQDQESVVGPLKGGGLETEGELLDLGDSKGPKSEEVHPLEEISELPEGPGLHAVSFRVRGKRPEEGTTEPAREADDGRGVGELPPRSCGIQGI